MCKSHLSVKQHQVVPKGQEHKTNTEIICESERNFIIPSYENLKLKYQKKAHMTQGLFGCLNKVILENL